MVEIFDNRHMPAGRHRRK